MNETNKQPIICPICAKENIDRLKCIECGCDLSLPKAVTELANRRFNNALELSKSGDITTAKAELIAAIEIWDENPKYYLLLGRLLANENKLDQAIEIWQNAFIKNETYFDIIRDIIKAEKFLFIEAKDARVLELKTQLEESLASINISKAKIEELESEICKLSDALQQKSKEIDKLNSCLEEKEKISTKALMTMDELVAKEKEIKDNFKEIKLLEDGKNQIFQGLEAFSLGLEFYENRKYQLAKDEFERSINVCPSLAISKTFVKKTERALEKGFDVLKEEKEKEFSRDNSLIRKAEINSFVKRALKEAKSRIKSCDFKGAIECLKSILRVDPANIKANRLLKNIESNGK